MALGEVGNSENTVGDNIWGKGLSRILGDLSRNRVENQNVRETGFEKISAWPASINTEVTSREGMAKYQ